MKKAKYALIITLILTAAVLVGGVAFAHFAKEGPTIDIAANTKLDPAGGVIEIADLSDLILAVTETSYNDSNRASKSTKMLRLTADIGLINTLVISRDASIDLAGFNIVTNGNDIEVRHYYSGVFNIFGGSIIGDGFNSVRIYTPNAFVRVEAVTDNISVHEIAFSADELFNAAFAMAADRIGGGGRVTRADNGALLSPNRQCIRAHAVSGEGCEYVSHDIDLPESFYGFNIDFRYVSDNEAVLSSRGIVTPRAGITDVGLKCILSYNGETRERVFSLHIYDKGNIAALEEAEIQSIANRLEPYYLSASDLYKIPEPIEIALKSNGADILYEAYGEGGTLIDTTVAANNKQEVFELKGEYASATFNSAVKTLKISGKTSGTAISLNVDGETAQQINDNYAKALRIARGLYGDELVVTAEQRDAELGNTAGKEYSNGYRAYTLTTDYTAFAKDGVTGISYSLTNNVDGTYAVTGGGSKLEVLSNAYLPTPLQTVNLCMRFEFSTEPAVVKINVPIRFDGQEKSDGDNIERFLPYYNYFDRLLTARTNNYTYNSFKMPFGHGIKGAVYYYEFYYGDGRPADDLFSAALTYSINGTSYRLTASEAAALDPQAVRQIMMSGSGVWEITINRDNLPMDDTEVRLRYRYKFHDYSSVWYGNADPIYESILTVIGVIKPGTGSAAAGGVIQDINLYAYIFDCAYPNRYMLDKESYNVGGDDRLIERHWLNDKFLNMSNISELNFASKRINDPGWRLNGAAITSLQGIEYVKRAEKVNLSSAGVTVNDAKYISGLTGVKELDLSSNALSDRKSNSWNLPSGSNNGFLKSLAKLPNLTKLHLENNKFYYFSDLTSLTALKEVCVFGNTFTGTLSNFVNAIYGTNGFINSSAYRKLTARKVLIHNVSESEGYKDIGSSELMDKLEAITYRKVLAKGENIGNAYAGLSTNYQDYGIAKQGSGLFASDDSMAFGYYTEDGGAETVNGFYLKYMYYTGIFGTTAVEIYVDFDIIRI